MKFVYIADTHCGGQSDEGYHRQYRYIERLDQIISALCTVIRETRASVVVHGGDFVDVASPDNIATAARLCARLPVPVRGVLGNHDMTSPFARGLFMRAAPRLFPEGRTDYGWVMDQVRFDFLTTHWDTGQPYFWESGGMQKAHFLPEQLEVPRRKLAAEIVGRVLVTHGPALGLPVEQTGDPALCHAPELTFTSSVAALVEEHRYDLVLGAHTHLNMINYIDRTPCVTVSALPETPFECKLIEVDRGYLRMQTIPLAEYVDFPHAYHYDAAYVQGRPVDRQISGPVPVASGNP